MGKLPVFLSVVFVLRNQSVQLRRILTEAVDKVAAAVSDFEIVVIDNASGDDSVACLKSLAGAEGLPNLQVYALTHEVDPDTASWVGLENALGDFVAVLDPLNDDVGLLPEMLDRAVAGADLVFAGNSRKTAQGFVYRCAFAIFNSLYRALNRVDLAKEAPHYRLLSRRVVNFILQHPQPALTYRHIPAMAGFVRANLRYSFEPRVRFKLPLRESIDRGMRLLVTTNRTPMRLVTTLSLFGAGANLVYSLYVVLIALFKADVAPGWTSLSLQQSGMFFLISLVLLVLGEYILQMTGRSTGGPPYHVGQEFTSARLTRREKLNVETPGADEGAKRRATADGRI